MLEIIRNKEFSRLPGTMSGTAAEALDQLLHTRDGQLCDIIVDKAALEAIYEAGKRSGEKIIADYADTTVAIADIKIAVRSRKTGKSADFMYSAMAGCGSVNVDQLIRARAGRRGRDCPVSGRNVLCRGRRCAERVARPHLNAGVTIG